MTQPTISRQEFKERQHLLKHYHRVAHQDAGSKDKYVRLKILDHQIARLKNLLQEPAA